MGRYARKVSPEQPEWLKWVNDRNVKFRSEISDLVEQGKCELLADTAEGRIYMTHFYPDILENAYHDIDEETEMPFPGEEPLRIVPPENQLRSMDAEYDLAAYLEKPQDSDIPILQLNFPGGFGSALVLANMVPRKLAETAILKIRNYLRRYGNKEYAVHKLSSQLQGREPVLQNQMDQILIKPLDCFTAITEGREFTYLFWAHFCALVKNDIKRKKEFLGEDIAAVQSVYIIDAINGFYRSLANRKREIELAFISLESNLAKPPYLFNMEQILKFASARGALLLSQYSTEGLEAWLREKTTESENNKMPELLIMPGPSAERCYLQKDKLFPYTIRLLAEARSRVRDEITRHWRKLLSSYRREPAMDNDEEFEKALLKFARKLCPSLTDLLEDPKLLLVYEEMEQDPKGLPPSIRIFNRGLLLPYSTLLLLGRGELLTDVKLVLPFWYTTPFISAIIRFFRNLFQGRKAGKETKEQVITEEKDSGIGTAAEELIAIMVPKGRDIDSFLEELETRWSRLINRKARENLIEDVKSLIRDRLRNALKIHKHLRLTQETISGMADNIVTRNKALSSLSGRNSLVLYAELFMLKLLREH